METQRRWTYFTVHYRANTYEGWCAFYPVLNRADKP